jgi:hypothetical protein
VRRRGGGERFGDEAVDPLASVFEDAQHPRQGASIPGNDGGDQISAIRRSHESEDREGRGRRDEGTFGWILEAGDWLWALGFYTRGWFRELMGFEPV